ncbi:MAG: RNA 3'-terminal phosphate cyclase [Cyanosarcina radialis HA8281-LM2]|jgi:RNA 3'-terminal phosphate cyclase (ATP)|nr:RNA 3'-terminal phosphate cyclase [Cyanosarcina radialis HA8281-LM2]
MIYLDGSYGEGGGQVLRTSLSLAAITGQPLTIDNIRAGRKKSGLAAQHLTAVQAAATICQAKVYGDRLGSRFLEFTPGGATQAGNYTFDVSAARVGGSAGAAMLVLQTVLLPLALAGGDSQVILRGGTHVPFSPPTTYIDRVYLPMLKRMGVQAEVKLNAWGWYPQGGGEVELHVKGDSRLQGIDLLERGTLQQVGGLAIVTKLPAQISQRMANRAEKLLQERDLKSSIQAQRESGIGAGAGIFLTAEYQHSWAGFSALGKLGLPAEEVAEIACREFFDFDRSGAPVDVHLADQLLLPAALATSSSQYRVAEISSHLTTNAWVIEQFGLAKIDIDEADLEVAIAPVKL